MEHSCEGKLDGVDVNCDSPGHQVWKNNDAQILPSLGELIMDLLPVLSDDYRFQIAFLFFHCIPFSLGVITTIKSTCNIFFFPGKC